jgi:glutathione S-transferase
MRLIYSTAACSISTHIVLEEIGRPFSTERVSTKDGGTRTGQFLAINPKGKVPVLVLDDGAVVTETPVVLQFLARSFPEHGLLPTDMRRQFEALQICEYLGNTVHTFGLTRIFQPMAFSSQEAEWPEIREQGVEVMRKAFELLRPQLEDRPLLFDEFSIADASLFFHELHAMRLRIPLPDAVRAHFDLMLTRPSVQRALAREEIDLADYVPAGVA